MWRVVVIVLSLVFVAGEAAPLRPRDLEVSSTRTINIPGFGLWNFAKVDAAGDLALHANTGNFTDPIVLEILHSSADPVVFKLPADGQDKFEFEDYSITPSGEVWMLVNRVDFTETFAFAFDSRGQVKSRTRLDLEKASQVELNSFTVTDDGIMLVSGHYSEAAAKTIQGHSFVSLFEQSGRRFQTLRDTTAAVDLKKSSAPPAPPESDVVAGADGNFYLLQPREILVINPTGDVVKRIHLNKPSSDMRVAHFCISGGQAAVWLSNWPKGFKVGVPVDWSYIVLDLLDGDVVGWYKAGTELGGAAIAFSRSEGFAFAGEREANAIKIVNAVPK